MTNPRRTVRPTTRRTSRWVAAAGCLAAGLAGSGTASSAAAAVTCAGETATIVGTARADTLTGTPGRDVIAGLGGRDEIDGLAGDDVICGGPNPDARDGQVLVGGPGDDRVIGGSGRDEVVGGLGDDLLSGGKGRDRLYAGSLEDFFGRPRPYGGADTLFAGAGNDELYGWDSRMRAYGGPGDDDLVGGERDDRLFGGDGQDILSGQEGDDTIRGGNGKDVLDYSLDHFFQGGQSHHRGVRVDLTAGVATGRAWGTDRISGIDKVWTGDGSDTVIGDDRRNVFYTGFGRRNEIDGRGGRDRVTFRADVIDGLCCDAVHLDLAAGRGQVVNPGGGFTEIRIRDVEDVVGSLDSDVILGDDGPNRLIGADEFGRGDRLVGRGGDDRLVGGGGDDRLNGGPGDNINEGGPGRDRCRNPDHGPGCE